MLMQAHKERVHLEEQIAASKERAKRDEDLAKEAAALELDNAETRRRLRETNLALRKEIEAGTIMQRKGVATIKDMRSQLRSQQEASCKLAAECAAMRTSCETLTAQRTEIALRTDAKIQRKTATAAKEFAANPGFKQEAELAKRQAALQAKCHSKLAALEKHAAAKRFAAAQVSEAVKAGLHEIDECKQRIEKSDRLSRDFEDQAEQSLKKERAIKNIILSCRQELVAANASTAAWQQLRCALDRQKKAWRQGIVGFGALLVVLVAVALFVLTGVV